MVTSIWRVPYRGRAGRAWRAAARRRAIAMLIAALLGAVDRALSCAALQHRAERDRVDADHHRYWHHAGRLVRRRLYGSLGRPLPSPLAVTPIRIGGAGIYLQELLLPITAIAAMFGLEFFYKRTTLGRAMRAVAFNRTAAGLMGINPDRMALIAFAMAGAPLQRSPAS